MKATRFIFSVLLLLLSTSFAFFQQSIPNDTFITLERTPCFGTCPFYKLIISADGKVEIEPKRIGSKDYKLFSGKRITSQTSQDQLKQLITEFESINYFSLEQEYGSSQYREKDKNCPLWSTDSPTVITSFTIAGKSNRVRHYHGCEGSEILERLTKLEDKIDEIVNTKQLLQLSIDAGDNIEIPSDWFDRYWNLSPKKEKARMKDIIAVIKQTEENYGRVIKIYLVYNYSQATDEKSGLAQATRAKKYLELYGINPEKIKIVDGGKEDKSEIVIYLD